MQPTAVKEFTAYDVLKLHLITDSLYSLPFEKFPLRILQINWEKAKTINLAQEPVTYQKLWKLILKVGLKKESVLPFVDPPIVSVIERFIDLGAYTIASCSAYPDKILAWVTLAFPSKEFGVNFYRVLNNIKTEKRLKINLNGYVARIAGDIGPTVAISHCLDRTIPLTISMETEGSIDCLNFWSAISQALNHFDNKGLFKAKTRGFLTGTPDNYRPQFLKEIWKDLLGK